LGTVTQTEQNRESSASSFFYGNGGTKFREIGDFVFGAVGSFTDCLDRLQCGLAQFNLCAHFLDLRSWLTGHPGCLSVIARRF
jgi:hypothetical protein